MEILVLLGVVDGVVHCQHMIRHSCSIKHVSIAQGAAEHGDRMRQFVML